MRPSVKKKLGTLLYTHGHITSYGFVVSDTYRFAMGNEFLTAVLVKNQVFWDVPCTLVQQSKGLLGLLDREHEDTTLPRKVGSYLPVNRP
jgi:hypothetical protein